MQKLEELAKSFAKHKAVNNRFYDVWEKRKLTIDEIEIFSRNYGEWVKSFPDTLAMLFHTTKDAKAKTEYVKTLYSEMGYGKEDKTHWILLDNFFLELSEKMKNKGRLERNNLEKKLNALASTQDLIKGERELYTSKNEALSVGAQMALEWQAYTMLRKLYEGARNYSSLWENEDEFHEACEYFYAHIGEAEKEHKKESIKAAEQYAKNEEDLEDIKSGYYAHLELIANFWEKLYVEIMKVNGK